MGWTHARSAWVHPIPAIPGCGGAALTPGDSAEQRTLSRNSRKEISMHKKLFAGNLSKRILALLGVGLLACALMAFSPDISHVYSSHAQATSSLDEHPFTIVSPNFA